MRHQATASFASDALPRQERVSEHAVWGPPSAVPRGHLVGDSTSSSSSFTPAPRHFGDPLLLSSFAADAPSSTLATKEFENAVSAVSLLEGVDHLVLPQKLGEADHETSEEENELPG